MLRRCAAALLLALAGLAAALPAAQAQTGPAVSSVAVTSTPTAATDTYGAGESIEVTVIFDSIVLVTGTPRIKLRIGGGAVVNQKWADYTSGSGGQSLKFDYVVQSGDADDNGIYIEANELELNGGTIQDATGTDATLSYSTLGTQADHKVDGTLTGTVTDTTPPALESATVSEDGTTIVLVFDEEYDVRPCRFRAVNRRRLRRDRRRQHRHHRRGTSPRDKRRPGVSGS